MVGGGSEKTDPVEFSREARGKALEAEVFVVSVTAAARILFCLKFQYIVFLSN